MNSKGHDHPVNVDFFEDLTGDITKKAPDRVEEIGTRIRSIRTEKNISLEELSQMTGFEVDFLSDIEQSKVRPQLGTIIRLSKALDSAFGRLVSGVGDRIYSITRKNDRRIISRSTSRKGEKELYTYHSLAPEVKGRHMEALIVQLAENPDKDGVSVHDGEEFIYVISGTVWLKIGEDEHELSPGDSVYYLSTTPHLIAAKQEIATILAVLYEGSD